MIPDPIVVEQSLPADPEVVWRAITDPALMRQWYFEAIEEFRPEVGFETAFDVDAGRRIFGHRWRVTEATPGRRLTYTWRYEGFAGEGVTVWKLTKIPGGTKLTLVCSGTESFPQDVPEFTRESGLAGWKYFIQQRLPDFLEHG